MKHGSLFSGIGGFDLASQWAGWENIFQVEIDPFCRKVLKKNFPNVAKYEDIKEFDGKKYANTIDVISGGFQPFSVAGKQRGKEDDRFLWPEMLRVVSEIRPTWIIGENVAGIINLGLEEVLYDLENEGYEVQSFIIPACSVNATHRRDRVWIVANSSSCSNRPKGRIQKKPSNIKYIGGTPWNEPWLEVATWLCRIHDGIPERIDRANRLKSLGNDIVPQVVFQIMQAINQIEDNNDRR